MNDLINYAWSEMAADKYFHIIVRIMITTLQSHQEAVFTD